MITNFPNPTYFIHIKKGDSVQFRDKMYRVQEDKGWLHIYPIIDGKRTKVDVRRLFFEPGTKADWIFNKWWKFYEFNEYLSFCTSELICNSNQVTN